MEEKNIQVDGINYKVRNINKKRINSFHKSVVSIFLAGVIFTSAGFIINKKENDDKVVSATETTIAQNDKLIEKIIGNGILVAGDIPTTFNNQYYIKDNMLYNANDEEVYFTNEVKPLYIILKNVDNKLLENIDLKNSKIGILSLEMTSIDDDFIDYIPSTIKSLSLNKSNFITTLNNLPDICPNIEYLCLNNMPMLTDFSFIYRLPHLKEVYLAESAYITNELLTYLKDHNIKTNITEKDLKNSNKIKSIIESLITPNMSDSEKLKAITMYVVNNIEYDISTINESNYHPLSLALAEKRGVCASYSYLTTVLLNAAGINAYRIVNSDHAWNVVELNDKYYNLDTTNIDASAINRFMVDNFNLSNYYITVPNNKEYGILNEATIVNNDIVNDILANMDDYSIYEKYKNAGIPTIAISATVAGLIIFLKNRIKSKKDTNSKKR